ncbi:MAG: hypothetical protein ACRDJW_12900 [Thermomicrobiales bacterium]
MTAFFELMDLTTANVVGHFATEDEALAVVRDVVADEGRDAVEELALSRQAGGTRPTLIAAGNDLAERALAQAMASS